MEKHNTSPDKNDIIVITLDGNIGVGKSTFLDMYHNKYLK